MALAALSNKTRTSFFLLAAAWYAVVFAVATAGAVFADSRFVTNAWHVYFIEKSQGVLTTDADITWSEIYRLIMATVASFLSLLCFLSRFNRTSSRNDITIGLSIWERRSVIFFSVVILITTLLFLPTNLHGELLRNVGALPVSASVPKEAAKIGGTLFTIFPAGDVVVKTDSDFGSFAQKFAHQLSRDDIESVTLWRDPPSSNMSELIATADPNSKSKAIDSQGEVKETLDLRDGSALSQSAIQRFERKSAAHSYISDVWRPYWFPYSFYSVGLWLLIIFPVLFFMVRSARTDWRRFRSPELSKPDVPQAVSEDGLGQFQKQSEHRLDAIRDIIPRYLSVSIIVCLIATAEFGVSYIRSSSTVQAATAGQFDLILIWVSCLIITGLLVLFYYSEYGYAFSGFESMENLATGPLYDKVRQNKLSFRDEYASNKRILAAGGITALILGGLLWVIKALGTTWIVPAVCGTLPPAVSNQIVRTMYASKFTKIPDCPHFSPRVSLRSRERSPSRRIAVGDSLDD